MSKDLLLTPFWALFRRETARFCKVAVQTLLTPLISTSLYLLIFGVSLGQRITMEGDITYLAFLIPGLVMMSCLNNAFQNSSSSIIAAKFTGELEDLKVAPLGHGQILWALTLAAMLRGFLVAIIVFAVSAAAYFLTYGSGLSVAHPLALVGFMALGGITFAQLGILVAVWSKNFDHLSAINGFILLPLIYLGGVFFSVNHLPEFWAGVARFNPLLYMINGVRYGILGRADVEPGFALMVTVAALVVSSVWSWYNIKKSRFQRW